MRSFDQNPFVVIWEMTRACALKCVHCRAEAIDQRNKDELSSGQAHSLLNEIRRFESPLVVLTGGDPMRRPDTLELVRYGSEIGLHMALTPSATSAVSFEILQKLKQAGLARLAVSLDGPTAPIHDAFRQVDGSYQWTLQIMNWANDLGLSLQINTTISRHTIDYFEEIAKFLESYRVDLWSVFFLVPVGRANISQEPSAVDFEKIFERMAEISKHSSYQIKSTEAPQYRRVLLQTRRQSRALPDDSKPNHKIPRPILPVNDGKGFVFISHTGEVYPSGFLPISGGNVKSDSLVDIYRNSTLFRSIRDYASIKGKCGVCEYKSICGGSRARAYAIHGDYMESDPFCVHIPNNYEVLS